MEMDSTNGSRRGSNASSRLTSRRRSVDLTNGLLESTIPVSLPAISANGTAPANSHLESNSNQQTLNHTHPNYDE